MRNTDNAYAVALPVTAQLDNLTPKNFISYYIAHEKRIEKDLLESGSVKFKGICIESLQDFQMIVNSISDKFLNYIDGNSPRTKLSGNVYTSTEFDKTQKI